MKSRLIAAILMSLPIACATAPELIESDDAVRLYTHSVGNGPPIVVIHGGPGMDQNSLTADLEPLTRNHRVIFYDQRGGGRSTLPADPSVLTIEHHVRDLEVLRRHFGIERLTLLAHSFGPAIAGLYAITYPQHVERMILLGPIPPRKGTFFEDYGKTMGERLSESERARSAELIKNIEASVDVTESCREYWRIQTRPRLASGTPLSVVRSDLCTSPPEAIRFGMMTTNEVTFGSLGDWDWTAKLATVDVPVLVIHGDQDAIPLVQVREWATSIPDARLLVLAGTGHFPHAEKPGVVFPAIETFLGGEWPEGAE